MTKNLPKPAVPARDPRQLNTQPKLIAVLVQQYCRLVGVQYSRQRQENFRAITSTTLREEDRAITSAAE